MRTDLTDTQRDILQALTEIFVETGRPPVIRELAKRAGWHYNTVFLNLPLLVAKGLVSWDERAGGRGAYHPTPKGIPELEQLLAQYYLEQLMTYARGRSLSALIEGASQQERRHA